MRKMKDSGIEWIGKIPKDWSITKIKFLLSNENDSLKVGPFGSQLSGSDFVAEGYWVYSQRVVLDKNFEHNSMLVTKEKFDAMSAFRVRENDILITTRGTIGKICRVPKKFSEGILHPCIIKFRIDEQKYCYKLLELIFNHSGILQKQLNYLSNATTIEVIYSGTLKNLQIPFPPLDEQKKIADFLDEKCGEIDSIRSDIQKQIDILNDYKKSVITEAVTKGLNPKAKLKDSGIEWIGKIPEGWDVKRFKYIADALYKGNGITKEQVFLDGNTQCVRYGEIYSKYNISFSDCLSLTKCELISSPQYFEHGDILFAGTGELVEEIGKNIVYLGNEKCLAGGDIVVARHSQNPSFLNYALGSSYCQSQKSSGKAKLKVVHISATQIGNILVAVPPLSEQKAIADYLDEKCSEIDATIADKQRQLETLDEYKKSLIFEYVTGKKEVPA